MYIPKLYREDDRTRIVEFLKQNDFATVVAYDGQKPVASHPMVDVIEADGSLYIDGHMARGNSLWKLFQISPEVLVIFQGPHTYISASWYNHVNVPTWNYQSVHVYGKPHVVTDHDQVYALLKRLMDRHETGADYNMDTLPPDFVKKEMRGVMAFRIEATHLEASYKLSQNRNDADYGTIISNLEARTDEMSHGVAEAMKRQRSKR